MNEILPPYNLEFSYGEVPQLKHQNLELDNKMVLLDSLLEICQTPRLKHLDRGTVCV